ncbi:bifunctional phosphoribosylaminoimidazole carboxylase/phosphoribosylaminoimidazole succinocarboxamide synthetase [Linepithema humile]|uniref:bifunctional phosphoribosylaminoimidazole carboxylase/phosphoribosylaminoimidazole succinocarboxamide synthetase n=1 Tax=Linepithema humile TaxID=83485 RepID=UPI0006231825|nr:PREDICTED: multifunctional protein ADE2 [Linepithema humile]
MDYKIGKLINEGKTKRIYELPDDAKLCLLESKDRITAGDGAKSHELKGKAEISTSTTIKVFQLLQQAGLRTAYVKSAGPKSFIAIKCEMIPIEWVTRRQATGSFLKRHPGVQEGHRFNPPLQETFFKDDANHDPQWSDEQIISANFRLNGVTITKDEVDIMKRITLVVFEILERAWAVRNCALIDMKIEFGVDSNGEIIVADIIDSDSWRLWPSGDKRLMKDKQVYRDLSNVTQQSLETVKCNFKWVNDELDYIIQAPNPEVIIFMGSPSDEAHCNEIARHAMRFGLKPRLRVCSAHKGTQETLNVLAEYEGSGKNVVLIAVAGRSNGLGPVLSGNSVLPVINCPPLKSDNIERSVWSSLDVPSGLGCTTVVHPEGAALAAAQIHAMHNHIIWARLRTKQLDNFTSLKQADIKLR